MLPKQLQSAGLYNLSKCRVKQQDFPMKLFLKHVCGIFILDHSTSSNPNKSLFGRTKLRSRFTIASTGFFKQDKTEHFSDSEQSRLINRSVHTPFFQFSEKLETGNEALLCIANIVQTCENAFLVVRGKATRSFRLESLQDRGYMDKSLQTSANATESLFSRYPTHVFAICVRFVSISAAKNERTKRTDGRSSLLFFSYGSQIVDCEG